MKLKLFKINKDSVQPLKEWGLELMGDLLVDAVNSLKEENCVYESAHLFYIHDEPYVVALQVPENGKKLVKGPDSEINKKHQAMVEMAVVEEVSLENLYTVKNL